MGEWQLIVKKAKKFLEAYIDKVDNVINTLKLK